MLAELVRIHCESTHQDPNSRLTPLNIRYSIDELIKCNNIKIVTWPVANSVISTPFLRILNDFYTFNPNLKYDICTLSDVFFLNLAPFSWWWEDSCSWSLIFSKKGITFCDHKMWNVTKGLRIWIIIHKIQYFTHPNKEMMCLYL